MTRYYSPANAAADVHCSHSGCPATTRVLVGHIANVLASGGWLCPDHEGRQ